jgi:signal transduction histidine kinase
VATSLIKFCIVTAASVFISLNAAAAELKRVVILHSYAQNLKPWSDYAKALRQELDDRSSWPLDFQELSLSSLRNPDESAEPQFIDYLNALFSKRAPDIIIALGGPAAAFVQRHRANLFPAVPMVLAAVEQRRISQAALTPNDAVVAVRLNVPLLFGNILQVLPDTRTIAVLIGNSPNEKFWIQEIQRELEPWKDRVKILFFNELAFDDALKQVRSLPPNSAIFWTQPQIDADGAVHEGERALRVLSSAANAPIFSYVDAFFGNGIVGGPMSSVSEAARKISDVVLRIMGGAKPADIHSPPLEFGPAKFDWRQLQRWGISEARLPPRSEIFFREPSAWHTYRWQIALVFAVILFQAALISRLLHEQRRRRLAEVQSRQRMSELAHVNRFSTAGELTATIAHEINQPLGAILANAETLELMLRAPSLDLATLQEIAADIRRDNLRASEVILRLRSLLKKAPFQPEAADLNDIVRETMVFVSALGVARRTDMRTSMTPALLPIRGDRIQLQQVILNLVVNAMDAVATMPAEARKIRVSTTRVEDFAEVAVFDDGPGIAPDEFREVFEPFFTTKNNGMGMGLTIARTIVEVHHGAMWAENQPSGGAAFRFKLPLVA